MPDWAISLGHRLSMSGYFVYLDLNTISWSAKEATYNVS